MKVAKHTHDPAFATLPPLVLGIEPRPLSSQAPWTLEKAILLNTYFVWNIQVFFYFGNGLVQLHVCTYLEEHDILKRVMIVEWLCLSCRIAISFVGEDVQRLSFFKNIILSLATVIIFTLNVMNLCNFSKNWNILYFRRTANPLQLHLNLF